jgi:hypothetical protein
MSAQKTQTADDVLQDLRSHFAAHLEVARADKDEQRIESASLALEDVEFLRQHVRETAAEALRDAADRYDALPPSERVYFPLIFTKWLRSQADRLETVTA